MDPPIYPGSRAPTYTHTHCTKHLVVLAAGGAPCPAERARGACLATQGLCLMLKCTHPLKWTHQFILVQGPPHTHTHAPAKHVAVLAAGGAPRPAEARARRVPCDPGSMPHGKHTHPLKWTHQFILVRGPPHTHTHMHQALGSPGSWRCAAPGRGARAARALRPGAMPHA